MARKNEAEFWLVTIVPVVILIGAGTTIAVFMMADGKKRGPHARASEPDLAYDRSLLG